ncbi:MAG TPA: 1,4-dihydroxy-2-naphthoate polyprenyltransferase [Jiangellaceae bacterium]|nr:1,4-dihydroxy-2-naphthoate polyprenyltransferase [Jiangellaceae bacterium]
MPALRDWVAGARPRTLPAAVSPVVVGTGAAAAVGSVVLTRAVLALVVAVALQVGVNYANDYSDGIRGTDNARIGPFRLVGSGTASPTNVRTAAFIWFAIACAAGLALVVLTGAWWLLVLGGLAVAAAWFYTGGSRPYGYRGLGEVSVFVFFGLVAVIGSTYVQVGRVTPASVVCGVAIGCLACAILVVNNLRDVAGDARSGKRTLAVVLGSGRTRLLYAGLLTTAYALAIALAIAGRPWVALAMLSAPLAARAARAVIRGSGGAELGPVLRDTATTELCYAALLALGLSVSNG